MNTREVTLSVGNRIRDVVYVLMYVPGMSVLTVLSGLALLVILACLEACRLARGLLASFIFDDVLTAITFHIVITDEVLRRGRVGRAQRCRQYDSHR